jgi:hypothetical protein
VHNRSAAESPASSHQTSDSLQFAAAP